MKMGTKKNIVIAAAIIAVLVVGVIVIAIWYNSPTQQISRLIDAGQDYLLNEDYENAISTFDKILAIDPKNEDAIENMARAYMAWSDKLYGEGDIANAVEVLSEGYEKTLSESVFNLLQERKQVLNADVEDTDLGDEEPLDVLEEPETGETESENSIYADLMKLFDDEDYVGIKDYVLQDDFKARISTFKNDDLAMWDYEEYYYFDADGALSSDISKNGSILVVYMNSQSAGEHSTVSVCRQNEEREYGICEATMYGDQEVDVIIETAQFEAYCDGETIHTFLDGVEEHTFELEKDNGVYAVWHM